MKNFMKIMALVLVVIMVASMFAGCSKAKPAEPEKPETAEEQKDPKAEAPEGASDEKKDEKEDILNVEGVDFSSPSIVINLDDYAAMEDFATKMQNFEIDEGTIVEITGYVGPSMMTHTINEPNEEGNQSIGTTYEVAGDVEYPGDGAPIHIVGVVRMGDYYRLLIVPAEKFEVLDAAPEAPEEAPEEVPEENPEEKQEEPVEEAVEEDIEEAAEEVAEDAEQTAEEG